MTISMDGNDAVIECRCKVHHKTGVEMEALTGATVACLTLHDMTTSIDKRMSIGPVRLLSKLGGKSGTWERDRK